MIELVKPTFEELSFRREWLAEPETMSYNARWGGVIDFAPDRWPDWYDRWVASPDRRFYRYLYAPGEGTYVGEASYHYDDAYSRWLCDVLVNHRFRGRGCGRAGLLLLCEEAKRRGIPVLCDHIALDNPAAALFERCGFVEKGRNSEFILLERAL